MRCLELQCVTEIACLELPFIVGNLWFMVGRIGQCIRIFNSRGIPLLVPYSN